MAACVFSTSIVFYDIFGWACAKIKILRLGHEKVTYIFFLFFFAYPLFFSFLHFLLQ